MTKKLSIIVPCYCEEESIPLFYDAVEKVAPQLPNIELEYWFIDDGSSDNTLGELRKLQQKDPEHVHYASFSRNFGKEAGLYCGLQQATGDYVAVMDVDLQDPPELLPKMLGYLESGEYDCVGTRRVDRKGEPPIRSFFAHMFYKLINKISDTEIVDGARDYRLMTRQMVDAILSMSEYNRFSKGIFSWVGFKTKYLEYQNQERVAGKTSWNFWSLLKYSIDGIVSFSQTPLNIASYVGLLSSVASVIGIIFVIVRKLLYGGSAFGWASMVCIFLFIGGIQLLCLGIVGKYIGKIFMEVKNRPVYILKEKK
ncbi:bactoprenol glucosyl transferase [Ligilactobacillus aviarius]|uniref:glycosyltransferase family 2 protein n=1 Tax=Ligilactobacillus aviarius TaxID=1606 RepID=UPI0007DA18F8|nr:glycosyltransferase family 2 protein [Ligilactobacillus aviarius]OAQ01544.1 bactoprenol glucosyl transferase [Ligilactobacillus aviarius]OAQ02776.1 bactoprenol glucosyl transferase [Ligilactobacillus aviarius]OAQ07738.1 bactoprenol glucosyl transferase [Ligilactobacillus aviarius]OAS75485.1 bactoprenol glucosyl transferase [Ligilactobacillus aviarius]OAS78444.1 bactoprenol glucosyl transferase [Ligilactobacillus aviarius]